MPCQKETIAFQPSIFGCELLVSWRVSPPKVGHGLVLCDMYSSWIGKRRCPLPRLLKSTVAQWIPCSSTFEFNLHFTNVRVKLALYHFEAFVTRPACFRIFSIWLLHMFVKQLCQLPAGSTTQKQGKIGMDMEQIRISRILWDHHFQFAAQLSSQVPRVAPWFRSNRFCFTKIADTSDYGFNLWIPSLRQIIIAFPSPGHDPWVQSYPWSSSQALLIMDWDYDLIFDFFGGGHSAQVILHLRLRTRPLIFQVRSPFQKSHLFFLHCSNG